jgi:hypothetical protein
MVEKESADHRKESLDQRKSVEPDDAPEDRGALDRPQTLSLAAVSDARKPPSDERKPT